jgi:hypothetical protein
MDELQISCKQALDRLWPAKKERRKSRQPAFEPRWVKLPLRWIKALRRSRSASTYQLALTILVEAFKKEQIGREIVLSTEVTGMPSSSRTRAVAELIELGMIRIKQNGKQAIRDRIEENGTCCPRAGQWCPIYGTGCPTGGTVTLKRERSRGHELRRTTAAK